jgi:hypothetical protein
MNPKNTDLRNQIYDNKTVPVLMKQLLPKCQLLFHSLSLFSLCVVGKVVAYIS